MIAVTSPDALTDATRAAASRWNQKVRMEIDAQQQV